MIYRIFFAAFLAILNFSSMNGSVFGVSPNQGFVEVIQEFYEFDVDSKHIIKIQSSRNFITIYTSRESSKAVNRGLNCCVVNKKYKCPQFIVRSDRRHRNMHSSVDELTINHFHLLYPCMKQIQTHHFAQVLNSLYYHGFVDGATKSAAIETFQKFLEENGLNLDNQDHQHGSASNNEDLEIACFSLFGMFGQLWKKSL